MTPKWRPSGLVGRSPRPAILAPGASNTAFYARSESDDTGDRHHIGLVEDAHSLFICHSPGRREAETPL